MRRLLIATMALGLALTACAGKDAVRRAVQEDPGMVMEVLRENRAEVLEIVQQALADQEQAARRAQWLHELDNPFRPVIESDRPVLGSVLAPVTVVEYSDFFCPYCDRGSRTVHELVERHPDVVKVVFKHYALHKGADDLAALFEAVALQDEGAAWEFKRRVFASQKALQREGLEGPTLAGILADTGVDVQQAREAARSEAIRERIRRDKEEARAFGFRGTPTFLIGGVAVRGAAPLEEFEQVLDLVVRGADGAAECRECAEE